MGESGSRVFDAREIKVTWPAGDTSLIDDCDYSDEIEMEEHYDLNGNYMGTSAGKYKADCKITVNMAEYEKLNEKAKSYGGLYNMPPFPLTVVYKNTDNVITDELMIKFKKRSKKFKKDDKNLTVPLETIVCGQIVWNGVPAYTPE